MKRTNERLLWISILTLSLGLNVLLFASPARADQEAYHKYQHVLQNVYHYVKNMYVEPQDDQKLITGAVRGILQATGDPYTRFLDREEHRAFNGAEEGRKVGVGVEVTMKEGYPVVIAPVEGGPAAKAGVKAGDKIVAIDGHSTERRSFGAILKLITGEIGTVVELSVLREGFVEPLKILVTRGHFNLTYVKGSLMADGKVGYVRLLQFFGESSGSIEKFRGYLEDFKKKKVKGIVVDLRNNSGGHLDMARVLAGYFLKQGDLVVTGKGRGPRYNSEYRAGPGAGLIPYSVPVIVLINKGSASASEVMAGALQDYGRAKLLGTQSFGKASVQQIVRPLPDDTAALITIQKYYTPKNRSIHGVGLKPDIIVEDIKPGADELYYLVKMREAKFLEGFKRRNPKYSRDLRERFQKEAEAKGWKFSSSLSLLLLKRSYQIYSGDKPDLELDPQLSRALAELTR